MTIPRWGAASGLPPWGYDYDGQDKQFVDVCNLCGGPDWTILTHRDRYGFRAQTTSCGTCGLTMLNPRMGNAGYATFYEGVYRPLLTAYYGRRIDAQTIQEGQYRYAEEMARLAAPFVGERGGQAFLDVGGSTGIVAVEFAKQFQLRPTVLDPAPDEVAEAEALGIQTITALVEDWEPGTTRYDVIALFQTVDHLLDVAGALAKLRAAVADDGLFVIDIVDFEPRIS